MNTKSRADMSWLGHKSVISTITITTLFLLVSSISIAFTKQHFPRFNEYLVGAIYKGKTHTLLPRYKDSIPKTGVPDAPQRKADFAGQYILIQGSCGTGCRSVLAMNAKTGIIYNFPHTIILDEASEIPMVRYHLNSKLLILHCNLDENEKTNGTYYYIFKSNHFVLLKCIHTKPGR